MNPVTSNIQIRKSSISTVGSGLSSDFHFGRSGSVAGDGII